MKKFSYKWTEDYYLLHFQLDRQFEGETRLKLVRLFRGGESKTEEVKVPSHDKSYRFLLSRTHPREIEFNFEYLPEMTLSVFQLEDRAYYPTEAFFVG
ncbi:MAG: hypothetical protein HQM10_22515 [Candidatus Riflebacteria bacterium]|nr:hypothetical protein [Candidatus Riflebacteria bacterium]